MVLALRVGAGEEGYWTAKLPPAELHRRLVGVGLSKPLIMALGMGMRPQMNGGCPTMSVATRQALQVAEQAQKVNVGRQAGIAVQEGTTPACGVPGATRKPRVFVAAENRLLREALSRMLVKNGEIEVVGMDSGGTIPR